MDNGNDHFVPGVCGHNCPDCGTSYDVWKVGDETVLANEGREAGYKAKVVSNDHAEIVFEIIEPGPYFGGRIHFMRGAVN